MQDRYVGDIGDFGKYGLLRSMFEGSSMRLGVNWYLMPDETHTNDGKHIDYLQNPKFRTCDAALFEKLQRLIAENKRRVSFVEQGKLLPDNTVFYSAPVPSGLNFSQREDWFTRSLQTLAGCDVLFLDPDNGLEVASVTPRSKKAGKYVTYQEVVEYYRAGFSLIVYNHRDRSKELNYVKRFSKISEMLEKQAPMPVLRFCRRSVRDYLFVIQDDLLDEVNRRLRDFTASAWKEHWKYFEV